jgi:hypothetical protein
LQPLRHRIIESAYVGILRLTFRFASPVEEAFYFSATVEYAKNQYVRVLHPVNNHIFAHGKAPQSTALILVARAAHMRILGEKREAVTDGID